MPVAVLQNGEIRPLEPLPRDWQEGQRLRVETVEEGEATAEVVDRDFAHLASLCADSDPQDEKRLAQTLQEARDLAKAQVRRRMGLT
jgi:hypothetical protein